MAQQITDITDAFLSLEERTRLIRLCASLTGNRDVAEDLAQETLLIAWKEIHTLRDVEKRAQWLSGIARNICLRWLRKHGRDLAHFTILPDSAEAETALENVPTDEHDIEVELERKELIALLDRAMALLPAETRLALVQHYVEESSLAEIAAQLGINASAVAMRLQRGKLALRRVLLHNMQSELMGYTQPMNTWEVTPFWCHLCGQQRLLGKRDQQVGLLLLKCPTCTPGEDELLSRNYNLSVLREVKGYKPLLNRLMTWCNNYYRGALRDGFVICDGCSRQIDTHLCQLDELPSWVVWDSTPIYGGRHNERVVATFCPTCLSYSCITLDALARALPESQCFAQIHPRMHVLPQQQVEYHGREAIITRFESVTDTATLLVASAFDTYETLHVERG